MALSVTAHRDLPSVRGLAHAWQALHDTSGDVNPFAGPDWALTWLEHFSADGGREPFVLSVHNGANLVGVIPLYRQTQGRAIKIMQPVGTGSPWIGPFEVPSMAADPLQARKVARAVVEHLCARSEDWDWSNLIFGSSVPWLEPQWLPDSRYTTMTRRMLAVVVLELDGTSDIYSGRRNLKESFRRARNRLTRDFGSDGWSVRRVQDAGSIGEAFDRLAVLHGVRAEIRDGHPIHSDTLGDPRVRQFVREVVQRMAARSCVSAYELLIGDEVVASQLILHTPAASYSSISGAGEAAWPYSAVTYLQSLAVADAQQAGHRQMALSMGPNQTKLRWTDQVDITVEFGIVGPRRQSSMLFGANVIREGIASFGEARRAHRV